MNERGRGFVMKKLMDIPVSIHKRLSIRFDEFLFWLRAASSSWKSSQVFQRIVHFRRNWKILSWLGGYYNFTSTCYVSFIRRKLTQIKRPPERDKVFLQRKIIKLYIKVLINSQERMQFLFKSVEKLNFQSRFRFLLAFAKRHLIFISTCCKSLELVAVKKVWRG